MSEFGWWVARRAIWLEEALVAIGGWLKRRCRELHDWGAGL